MSNRQRRLAAVLIALLPFLAVGPAAAAGYDEALDGDISGDRFAPTVIPLAPGENLVRGFFGRSPVPDVADLDYFILNVPAGYELHNIVLADLNPGGANSFLGLGAGAQFPLAPNVPDPSPLLTWAHVYTAQVGLDLMPAVLHLGAPLPAGSYTFWSNETDTSALWSYAYQFNIVAVPEPRTALLIALGLVGLGARRRLHAVTRERVSVPIIHSARASSVAPGVLAAIGES